MTLFRPDLKNIEKIGPYYCLFGLELRLMCLLHNGSESSSAYYWQWNASFCLYYISINDMYEGCSIYNETVFITLTFYKVQRHKYY